MIHSVIAAALLAHSEAGFTPLFNGTDLTGWNAVEVKGENPFAVKDGVIAVSGKGGKLLSAESYKDFELRLEFRFVEKASDGGVFFRMPPGAGYQVQTKPLASVKGLGEIRAGSRTETPARTHDIEQVKKAMKPVGEWQSYAITARGARAEVRLNGVPVCTADGLTATAGPVGLQAEYGKLEFRNLRIKPLPPEPKP